MTKTKNNHFISKFLIRPWEFKKGKVRVFRYSDKTFQEFDSETLFAKEKIFTQKQEEFFNKYVETISREELYNCEKNKFKTGKWKNYRAVHFLIWDLVGRYRAANSSDFTAVNIFTSLEEDGLNQLALAIDSKYLLVVITIPENGRLFFPSNFLLYAFDERTIGCNFGVPFDGRRLIMTVDRKSDFDYLDRLAKSHFFVNQSAGNYATEFVIVHPDITLNESLAEQLLELRERNQKQAAEISEIRASKKLLDLYSVPVKKT